MRGEAAVADTDKETETALHGHSSDTAATRASAGIRLLAARRYRGSRSLLLWTAASVADVLRKLNQADGRWQSVF